ncbi:MAG: aquaporin, partial [Candidatus Methanomethylophilaceae archaeon]|nr:aquaporin [Candidatus Methanomethylophilaceae archaeon]
MAISFENPREYIAELIGTAIIMAVGVTVGSLAGMNGFSMLTAFAFAIAFIGLVYFIGSACNCHFNPLISLSMFINGRMKGNDLLWYILAQFVGGILGCLLAFYLVTQTAHTNVIGY